MGYIKHDAIVVTGFDVDRVERARKLALDAGLPVSERVSSPINGYESFFIAPDGSKEGWAESSRYEDARASFVESVRSVEPPLYVDWVAVSFGGDARAASVTDHGDKFADERDV
jgi:ABC-type sugar transport system substrate-binding protein